MIKNTIFFKAYSVKYDSSITDRPSYFGEIDNASKYLKKGRKLGVFSTKIELKLLDIRYLIQIINDLILLRKNNDFETIIKGYMTIALSYGLVSLHSQLNLYKSRYLTTLSSDIKYKKLVEYLNDFNSNKNKQLFQNPLELQGIRIGETNNDVETTFILKEIFGEYFDGFISPVIFSPYFDENFIPNEILLFNPLDVITQHKSLPNNSIAIDIYDILSKNNINLFSVSYFMKNSDKTYFQYGGYKKNSIDYIFEKNLSIIKNKSVEELKKQGNEFKKYMIYNKINISNDYMFDRNNEIYIKNLHF